MKKTGMTMERENSQQKDFIRRFMTYRIAEHGIHIVIFVLLVITGLSQKYYYLNVSQWTILQMGGIDVVRMIHRFSGLTMVVLAALHVVIAVTGITLRKWQPSMIITRKDFDDVLLNIKYYLGIKEQPAQCDRYNYKQKFEYWSILIGVIMMMASGIILWFPTVATQYLPGVMIPVAKAFHTNGALLIVLIIAIWHIYNSIFSPEVFPLDTSIFTGNISRRRMMYEHPLELKRIDAASEEAESRYFGKDSMKVNT